jgi:adenine-specific DNA-methyltransferase
MIDPPMHPPVTAMDPIELESPKTLGAYYTHSQIADFLVGWAVRSRHDKVFDPSFGGGVFLRSACKRLRRLGGDPATSVLGVEVDQAVHRCIADKLFDEFEIKSENLIHSDFFALPAAAFRGISAIVGNPPFIRYQRFSGETRTRALLRTREAGVRISELASSWAPFLIHSASLLAEGGRLAMVVPAEIGHASYARPILEYFGRSFRRVTFLTFRKRLFPALSEDTLLLLADHKSLSSAKFDWKDVVHAGALADFTAVEGRMSGARALDAEAVISGRQRLVEQFLPKKTQSLYAELKTDGRTKRLGEIADVGIGYVTGANDFFHVNAETARKYGIPDRFLKPAVRRGRDLTGLRFTQQDWDRGEASHLLKIESDRGLPSGLNRYIAIGEAQGLFRGYKCRTRTPWFKVPHVHEPDAFLTYMSGHTPRLVANDAHVVAPNTLHILRFDKHSQLDAHSLAALWRTSVSELSAEIEGHPLGGGMLKLEPTEAEHVLVPNAILVHKRSLQLTAELDAAAREGREGEVQRRADEAILREELGLSRAECLLLAGAATILRRRRYARTAA